MTSSVTNSCLDCYGPDVRGVCLYVVGKALQRQGSIHSSYAGQTSGSELATVSPVFADAPPRASCVLENWIFNF